MPGIKAEFKSSYGSASFEGVIDPDGATGYTFSGVLKATCGLNRSSCSFKNMVRLGHGGASMSYDYVIKEISEVRDGTIIAGRGERAANESVDFRVGINEGLSGQYEDGYRVGVEVGGPEQAIQPTYSKSDSNGNLTYDVSFNGSVRADGPTGFVIKGTLSSYASPGTLTKQSATVAYGAASGAWACQTYGCDEEGTFRVTGSRKAGEAVQVKVGATSGIANSYNYGDVVECKLMDGF